jgi:hypothetical protein
MINIQDNLEKVNAKISQSCIQNGRSGQSTLTPSALPVSLLAVSKTKPSSLIEQAYFAGQINFGENYLQEALQKITELSSLPDLVWHFIGPIQSNKTKQIANNFSWVHSVDREKIALRLNRHLSDNDNDNYHTPLNICLQVNISLEASKSGTSAEALFSLAEVVNNCNNLTLRGLMAIPDKNATDACYQAVQQLFLQLKSSYASVDTLSLGMSNDLNTAIAHGSTMVRVGTDIFGRRTKNNNS